MDLPAVNQLALCGGIGGLELAVGLAGVPSRVVAWVEREAYGAAVLAARMEQGLLGQAPIWDDLTQFDGRPWRGLVDLVTAGYPCQPDSLAGARAGEADERWLWHEVWRVIREVEPGLVFLENVPGHLSGTFGRVLGDLAAGGWSAEWDCVPAAAVGAPHIRDRVFILAAHPDGNGLRWLRECGISGNGDAQSGHDVDGCAGAGVPADSGGAGPEVWTGVGGDIQPQRATAQRGGVAATANANHGERVGQAAGRKPTRQRISGVAGEEGVDPDTECSGRKARRGGLTEEAGREELERMDRGAGWERQPSRWATVGPPEPVLRRVDDGIPRGLDRTRSHRLYVLGNAVVRDAGARAFRTLAGRLVAQ